MGFFFFYKMDGLLAKLFVVPSIVDCFYVVDPSIAGCFFAVVVPSIDSES